MAEAPLFEDSQGNRYSTLIRVKFGEHVFDVPKGQKAVTLADARSGYAAVTNLFDQLETDYGKYTLEKMAPSIVWGDTLRANKRTGATVIVSDYSQLFEVWFDAPVPLTNVVNEFEALRAVAYAEKPQTFSLLDDFGSCPVDDVPSYPNLNQPPDDPDYLSGNQYSLSIIEAAKAWGITRGMRASRPTGIAILDYFDVNRSGSNMHGDLQGKLTVLGTVASGGSHGYRVSGLAGAQTNNKAHVASLGWEADLYGFDSITSGLMQLFAALYDPGSPAYGRVDVVNMSSVIPSSVDPYQDNDPSPGDQPLAGLIRDLLNVGIVVVAASGNGECANVEQCTPPCTRYPAALSYDDLDAGDGTTYTGQVIAVSLTDWNDEFYEGTDYSPGTNPLTDPEGAYIDVTAPGLNVRVLSSGLVGGKWEHSITSDSGTSLSSPIVAALAALVLSVNPTLRVDEVYDIITRSAEKVDQNEHPDSFFYTDPETGETLGWNQRTGYGRVNAYRALVRTLELHGGTLAQDVTIPAGETWDLGAVTLAFAPGTHLIVEGTLNADGTTFTESDPGSGWGGIIADGTLDLDGATIEHADTGIIVYEPGTATIADSRLHDNTLGLDVRSATGTVVNGSVIEQNGTGVETGFIACYGASCPCFTSCRSDLTLGLSATGDSTYVRDNTGVGVSILDADAHITDTWITGNGSTGLTVSNALVSPFLRNVIEGNGSYGISVLSGGDLFMSPQFFGFGRNRVANNASAEVFVYGSGIAFLGDSQNTGRNSVFDTNGGTLIVNTSPKDVDAVNTYWDSFGAPPTGAFAGFSPVVWTPVSDCDYTVTPPVCLAARSPSSGTLAAVGSSGENRIEFPDGPEALAEAIVTARTALAADPASAEAPALARELGALHRYDHDNELGEWAGSAALLGTIRSALAEEGVSETLRATAEAALEVEAVAALGRGDYETTAALLTEWSPLVESASVGRALTLVEAHAEAAAGRYAEASSLVESAAVTESEAEAQAALWMLAEVYAARTDDGGGSARGGAITGASREGTTAVAGKTAEVGTVPTEASLAVYPNPSAGQALVAVALPEVAEVSVVVYDVLGRRVATLAEGRFEAGTHRFHLDAARLPAGVYLVRAEVAAPAATRAFTARLTVVK